MTGGGGLVHDLSFLEQRLVNFVFFKLNLDLWFPVIIHEARKIASVQLVYFLTFLYVVIVRYLQFSTYFSQFSTI
jgi:hypothetical protein